MQGVRAALADRGPADDLSFLTADKYPLAAGAEASTALVAIADAACRIHMTSVDVPEPLEAATGYVARLTRTNWRCAGRSVEGAPGCTTPLQMAKMLTGSGLRLPIPLGCCYCMRCDRLVLLSLQSSTCPSRTVGCLRAWQFPLHLLVSDLAHPTSVSRLLPHGAVGQS